MAAANTNLMASGSNSLAQTRFKIMAGVRCLKIVVTVMRLDFNMQELHVNSMSPPPPSPEHSTEGPPSGVPWGSVLGGRECAGSGEDSHTAVVPHVSYAGI